MHADGHKTYILKPDSGQNHAVVIAFFATINLNCFLCLCIFTELLGNVDVIWCSWTVSGAAVCLERTKTQLLTSILTVVLCFFF